MKFETSSINNIEKSEKKFEVMKMPEIVFEKEYGSQLFSLLLKAQNPEWGELDHPLAEETNKYFENNPLSSDVKDGLEELFKNGADEESLYNLALAYNHPERLEAVFAMIAEHKPNVKNPTEVQQNFFKILQDFDGSFSSSNLAKNINEEIERVKAEREDGLEKTEEMIEELVDFFRPNVTTTNIKRINFIPADPLYRKDSGKSFSFGDEQVVASNIENTDNQKHEFLHGIINPIVDKLSEKLTEGQKEKISEMASEKLKRDYGNNHYSLLCEELIRTHRDMFGEEGLITYEKFVEKISKVTDSEFQEELAKNKKLEDGLHGMGIKNIEDLRDKSREYYDKYVENELVGVIEDLYKGYLSRENKDENFEHFILENFTKMI